MAANKLFVVVFKEHTTSCSLRDLSNICCQGELCEQVAKEGRNDCPKVVFEGILPRFWGLGPRYGPGQVQDVTILSDIYKDSWS